jgi:hypothetical protein
LSERRRLAVHLLGETELPIAELRVVEQIEEHRADVGSGGTPAAAYWRLAFDSDDDGIGQVMKSGLAVGSVRSSAASVASR